MAGLAERDDRERYRLMDAALMVSSGIGLAADMDWVRLKIRERMHWPRFEGAG